MKHIAIIRKLSLGRKSVIFFLGLILFVFNFILYASTSKIIDSAPDGIREIYNEFIKFPCVPIGKLCTKGNIEKVSLNGNWHSYPATTKSSWEHCIVL